MYYDLLFFWKLCWHGENMAVHMWHRIFFCILLFALSACEVVQHEPEQVDASEFW